ncbi:DUF6311 domain-containing protein [Falsiroseomonas selenitidurans]|uniref:Glycosyltransferase RgtA/B/C/D-like domain-containing protein n=1 Tax=Falsiroseomonas selenitidurans TaxID=2716335 RepID=A0ABX1EBU5_9PROT|nr:DUF6311 domain-containing protein [Falsiroseomonas selenitidurans]NKC32962.1 hypothetical protein [Falsiroseomonas selenitidurans]
MLTRVTESDVAAPRFAAGTRRLALALALLGGALAAIVTLGPRILDIRDLGWLLHGTLGPDPVAYLVAWQYLATSPWSWPPGLNPDYGIELSSAIFYVDAVPLLAFLAKALRPVLEVPQYWGPWMVLCSALQAGFGWKLLGEAVEDPVARGLGAVLLAFQPMLLNRMGGHFPLVAQWAVLWALWLAIRPVPRRQGALWVACLGLAALMNAYITAMCGLVWAADWVNRAWQGRIWRGPGAPAALVQAVAVPGVTLGSLWLAGFFSLGGEVMPVGLHYGYSQFDLTAPFDALEWGRLLPELPGLRHWEVGGSYLGAGSLALMALAGVLALRAPAGLGAVLGRRLPLLAMLLAMLGFAISNRLAIAGQVFPLFEVPHALLRLADMLRASERFFWPLGYALIFAAAALVARRLPLQPARAVLAGALLLQLGDIEAGMGRFRDLVAQAPRVAADRLPDPFWPQAALRYSRVRAVPAGNFALHWEEIARFAAPRHIPTDAVYLSRIDPALIEALNARTLADLAAGRWEPGTLYVLRDAATEALVRPRLDPARDLLGQRDGLTVFAPGWFAPR